MSATSFATYLAVAWMSIHNVLQWLLLLVRQCHCESSYTKNCLLEHHLNSNDDNLSILCCLNYENIYLTYTVFLIIASHLFFAILQPNFPLAQS